MKEIKIVTYKASDNFGEVPQLMIVFNLAVPQIKKNYMTGYANVYKREAKKIVAAFLKCLPGGLVDALLVELLDKRRSILSVLYTSSKKDKP